MKRNSLGFALILLLLTCLIFGWIQNQGHVIGGSISVPKVLWLNLAIASFLVIPAFLWRDEGVLPPVRQCYGWFLAGFAIRAAVELPMIYGTRAWRCGYGIAHDCIMMGVVIAIWWRASRETHPSHATRLAKWFSPLLLLVLICEVMNAWLFSRVADPATGVYFANASDDFRFINIVTWIEIATIYPLLGYWIIKWNGAETRHP